MSDQLFFHIITHLSLNLLKRLAIIFFKGLYISPRLVDKILHTVGKFTINLPITKDHMGNKFTGTMKNLMGLSSPKTNRTFHTGNFKNDDINHLDQCIADLNTLIKPVLCVVDATEFIITNGPFGPGKLHKPQKVVAGTDRVAIDAYCASLWGLKGEEIIMIREGHALGLGEIDLAKRKIKEVEM